jgi:hypothetical protein
MSVSLINLKQQNWIKYEYKNEIILNIYKHGKIHPIHLKRYKNKDTDPIEVSGTPDNYLVRDGHHRMQAYENAKRTEVPVFIAYKGVWN